MGMSEQMILTIFVIAVTFGAKPKLQIGIILVSPAADGTFVLCHFGIAPDILTKLHSPLDLLWI